MAHSVFQQKGIFRKISSWVTEARRTGIVDSIIHHKPLWAQLNITDKCNLSCAYCTEYNNQGKHVPYETVIRWIEKSRDLGVKHLQFIGGEPLLHPRFMDLVKINHQNGITTGLTTNGFLLYRYDLNEFKQYGLNRIQVSIDNLKQDSISQKSLEGNRELLEALMHEDIWLRVNSVVTGSTVQEAKLLAQELFAMGIPTAFSPIHFNGQLNHDSASDLKEFFTWLQKQKICGNPVDMPNYLIGYYRDWYDEQREPIQWICNGGSKAFYVDTKGQFRFCTHTPPRMSFEDVEEINLKEFGKSAKGCEYGCGVQCMIANSIPFKSPGHVIAKEIFARKDLRRG